MHAPLVRLAAAKRLPVLCQKPLAPNLQEAIELAAEVEGLTRLMVHENWRFRGYYRDAAAGCARDASATSSRRSSRF